MFKSLKFLNNFLMREKYKKYKTKKPNSLELGFKVVPPAPTKTLLKYFISY